MQTHIQTDCPWCSSANAQIDNPDLPNSSRILQGTCPDCERAFEIDQWDYLDLDLDLDEFDED